MDMQSMLLIVNAAQDLLVIISILVLVYQLKQFNQSLRQDAYARTAEYSIELHKLTMHKKPLADLLLQHNTDYLKLNNAQKDFYTYLSLVFGILERLYLMYRVKGIDQKTWKAWEKWLVK